MNKTIFIEDLENRRLIFEREFNAPVALVWRAWTESKLLDRWWAPKPWRAKTKFMDFRVGGYWLYCMNGPEGEQSWGRADYEKISVNDSFSAVDSFCDEDGIINAEFPTMSWVVKFTRLGAGTRVVVKSTYSSVEDLKKVLEMGMKEGFTSAQDNLEALLAELTLEKQ